MQMDEGMDTGDILLPRAMAIRPDDTAGTLATRMAILGGEALIEALELLKKGQLPPRKQDHRQATNAPPLVKEMGCIDWQKSAWELSCLIRGLDPWPTAYTRLDGNLMRLFRPQVREGDCLVPPGVITKADQQGLFVATGQGTLQVEEIQREGGKRLAVADFLRGHPLAPGSRFTP